MASSLVYPGGREPAIPITKFPFPTALIENPVTSSVALTVTQIFRNNPNRVFWYAENVAGSDARFAFNRGVSATSGLLVPNGGGWVSMLVDEDGEAVQGEVFALAISTAVTLYAFEIVRV